MKLISITTIAFLFCFLSFGQHTYHISKTKEKGSYLYQKGSKKTITGSVYQTYKDGQKEFEINYVSGVRSGKSSSWFNNGNLSTESYYSDGDLNGSFKMWDENGLLIQELNFKNGIKHDLNKEWFPNGNLKKEENYHEGLKDGVQKEWNSSNVLISEVNYRMGLLNGSAKDWYDNGQLKWYANYLEDTLNGVVEGWYENGQMNYKYESKHETVWHDNGQLLCERFYPEHVKDSIKENFWNASGEEIDKSSSSLNFEEGSFPGGIDSMFSWIVENVNYPEYAREMDVSGRVYIAFVVENSGRISSVELLKSTADVFNEESLNLIRKMPNWVPSKINGVPTRISFVLPITFQLGN
jgi:TonB family protein